MGSIHNELRYQLEILEQFQKAFRLEHSSGVERLGETLTPIVDMWSRIEMAASRREALWWAATAKGAVSLQNSFIGILNPAGSGLIVTVEGWATDVSNAQVGSVAQASALAGAVAPVDARDRRFGSSQSITNVKVFANAAAALGNTDSWDRVLVNTLYLIPCVIQPGNNFAIVNPTANAVVSGSFFGRARRATDQELQIVGAL